MAQLVVRNIESGVKARLQRRAKRNGRSMEAEVREIVRNALREEEKPAVGLGSATVALFSGQGACSQTSLALPTFAANVDAASTLPDSPSYSSSLGQPPAQNPQQQS